MEIEKKIVSPNKKFKSLVYREKAGRRSPWTCNFFIGCSNGCTYCCCSYILKHNWDTKVKLIKHFQNEDHALKIFKEEVIENLDSLRSRGRLFFSLTTDAMLPETKQLTYGAMKICHDLDVPFKVLTKCTQWVNDKFIEEFEISGTVWGEQPKMNLFAFGFSLTGQDEVEIGTDSNLKRINALIKLKKLGFRTFASFEPVIDFDATLSMIMQSHSYIDFMRIGLLNGPTRNKNINLEEMDNFFQSVMNTVKEVPVYWGDSILLGLEKIREELPKNCVVEEIF
jgi:DNA repair photolyase